MDLSKLIWTHDVGGISSEMSVKELKDSLKTTFSKNVREPVRVALLDTGLSKRSPWVHSISTKSAKFAYDEIGHGTEIAAIIAGDNVGVIDGRMCDV
jgi:hypothetical protein